MQQYKLKNLISHIWTEVREATVVISYLIAAFLSTQQVITNQAQKICKSRSSWQKLKYDNIEKQTVTPANNRFIWKINQHNCYKKKHSFMTAIRNFPLVLNFTIVAIIIVVLLVFFTTFLQNVVLACQLVKSAIVLFIIV